MSTWTVWRISTAVFVILVGKLSGDKQPYFKECAWERESALSVWLGRDGNCFMNCEPLLNCTTFSGNLVIRQSLRMNFLGMATKPTFPLLTEITGYLIFFFIRQRKDLYSMFPNLAVIRGDNLFINYALVIYQTDMTQIDLRSLTLIKRGGVRIERNNKMCYVRSVRWDSIILEKGQDESNFGIMLSNNNKNCYDVCYTRQCYAPRGHGRSGIQYCWGPGSKNDMECQRLCDGNCGPSGCVEGTTNICCHTQCLGGCLKENSPNHCFACKYYRAGPEGTCVEKCPKGRYLVNNFKCELSCPNPNLTQGWINRQAGSTTYYSFDGVCVQKCPAGYLENLTTKTCDKCVEKKCPRVCKVPGREVVISDLSDLKKYELIGCTTIEGNLRIQIRGGSSESISAELYKSLGTIEVIRGYLSITESVPLRSLDFLSNLRSVEPGDLLALDRYAIAVFDNPKLKSLWKMNQKINITKGNLFFHLNPNLCPEKIRELLKATGRNSSVDVISESTNGNEVFCNMHKINITVEEVGIPLCLFQKCLRIRWMHDQKIDSRILPYYGVYYGILPNDQVSEQYGRGCGTDSGIWKKVDKTAPGFDASGSVMVQMEVILTKLKAYTLYGIYVEGRALKGRGRRSDLIFFKTSFAYPSAPLGLEASFLSPREIKITWSKPDEPNGVITHYKIYFQKISYSVWKEDIDWCTRDLHLTENLVDKSTEKEEGKQQGSCPRNYTCPCEVATQKSKAVESDRNAQLFKKEFEDKVLNFIFVKPKKDKPGKRGKRTQRARQSVDCSGTKNGCIPKSVPPQTFNPKQSPLLALSTLLKRYKKKTSVTTPGGTDIPASQLSTTATPTNFPIHEIEFNSTEKLEYTLEELDYFQDYLIRVCACNDIGCSRPMQSMSGFDKCAGITGRTDINNTADSLENLVTVRVQETKCIINWFPPPRPNGIVLKYDIAIRSSSGNEIIHCHLGQNPTTFTYEGLPGNYTVKLRAISPAGNGSWTSPISFAIADVGDNGMNSGKGSNQSAVIGIGIAAALAMVALIIFIVYYAFMKQKTDKGIPGVLYASVNPEYMNKNLVYIEDEWEVPREKIELVKELGQGSFGMVYEGIARDIVPDQPECRVAVKTVNEKANAFERMEFLKEASVMKAFDCNHVVRLIGVVSKGQPSLVVMELMGQGDLKTFLRKRRPKQEKGSLKPPTLEETLQMAAEIADGMAYLASLKFVHRDLAARNCMVASDYTVKIGDFGMTRDVYETDYYRKGGKGLLPVRWMAPESLKDGLFTVASDVWSYGVVLWEMATLAAQPYTGLSNEEVLKFVINGGVLERPEGCPERLYYLMNICWRQETKERPNFIEIIQLLEDDLNDNFRKLSFYYQQLQEGSPTMHAGMPRSGASRQDVARSRGKMNHVTDEETLSDLSSVESTSEEHWKPEADRSLEPIEYEPSMSARRTTSLYDNDGTPETENNMRYDEGSKGSWASRGSKAFRHSVPTMGRYSLSRAAHV